LKYNRFAYNFASSELKYPDFTPVDFSYFVTDITGYPFSYVVLHSDKTPLPTVATDVATIPEQYDQSVENLADSLDLFGFTLVLDYIDNSVDWNF
jgi:hypothetical protein